MRTTSSQKIKIGLFVIIGLVVLFLGIFLIGNQKSMFSSTFTVNSTFKNVSGLMVGNNVRFAGINVGVVQSINIVSDSTVKVAVTLNNSVNKFIKKDCKMAIGSDGLMGDKLIVISPGGIDSQEQVSNGDQLASVNPIDIDKIIGKLTRVADNAELITTSLAGVFNDLNHGKGTLGQLLHNDKIAKDLAGTIASAKTTMSNVNSSTVTLHEDLKAAQGNFLLKGFFNKKKKALKAKQDSIKKAQDKVSKDADKAQKQAAKDAEKAQKQAEKDAKKNN